MDTQTRIGIGASAGICIFSLLEPHMNSYLAMAIFAVLVVFVAWGFWPILKSITIAGLSLSPYRSLPTAVARYYGRTRGTAMAEFAEKSSKSPNDILNWYGYWMSEHGVRIYGKRPPSPQLELIPKSDIGTILHFVDGAAALQQEYNTHPTFTDLSVKWTDLIKNRKSLLG